MSLSGFVVEPVDDMYDKPLWRGCGEAVPDPFAMGVAVVVVVDDDPGGIATLPSPPSQIP